MPAATAASTPDLSADAADLSADAAAAVASAALREAKARVEALREKVRGGAGRRAGGGASQAATLAGLLGAAVALLMVCVMVVDPRVGSRGWERVVEGAEAAEGRVVGWWGVGGRWVGRVKTAAVGALGGVARRAEGVAGAGWQGVWQGVDSVEQVFKDAGRRLREGFREAGSRVRQLRAS